MYICNSFWHLHSVHIQFPLQLCYKLLMFFDFCLKATENFKKCTESLKSIFFKYIVKHIHLFFANKYYSTKYEALNEKFRNLLFNSCKFELKHSTQPQINDCSNRQILGLTRRCYFERLKWKSKFVMKKEFFSTFALHYLYQGSIRTAKSNFLILHHLQFLM